MNELEKIKREIDDDLRKLGAAPITSAQAQADTDTAADAGGETGLLVYNEPSATAAIFSAPDFSAGVPEPRAVPDPAGGAAADISPAEAAVFTDWPADGSSDGATVVTEGFYRETIKQAYVPERKPRMSWRKKLVITCLACTLGTATLGMGIGSAIILADYYLMGGIERASQGKNLTDNSSGGYGVNSVRYIFSGGEGAQEGSLSDMIELVEPSVVSVAAMFPVEQGQGYGMFPGYSEEYRQEAPQESIGSASGILFKEDGRLVYIATNDHVVRGAASVNVLFAGSEEYIPATQVGMNEAADLAVISVAKRDLKLAGINDIVMANFGDSDSMEMGDAVIAIGNALGRGNIATQGIVSATEKIIPVDNRNLTVIQTDAAINFGNSGGALFNINGEVIGINSAKLMAYSVEGMGFSISSNIAVPILEDLMKTSSRPSLGIYGADFTPELAEREGITETPFMGVYVDSLIPEMGAEKAGILPGDVITGFNNAPVLTMEQLKEAIRRCGIGETVEVNILRGGKLTKVSVEMTGTVVNGFSN